MQTIRHLTLFINVYMALERQPKRFESAHKTNESFCRAWVRVHEPNLKLHKP